MLIFTILLLLVNSTLSLVFEYGEHPKHRLIIFRADDKAIFCLPGYISIKNTPESMKTYQLSASEFENIKDADESEYEKYCSRLEERYTGEVKVISKNFDEYEKLLEEKELKKCTDEETGDIVLISELQKILFSEDKSKPFNNNGENEWKFKGTFVSFEDYNSILPDNQFSRCLETHGINSDEFKNYMVFVNGFNIPEQENCRRETIKPLHNTSFLISQVRQQRYFGSNVYDLKIYLKHRCDPDICENNCGENEIYVINTAIKNKYYEENLESKLYPYDIERVKCTKKSYKGYPVPKSEIYCACENLEYENSNIRKYPRKTLRDYECKEGFVSTKKSFDVCPAEREKLCIRPLCPVYSCGPQIDSSLCSFSVGQNKKTGNEKFIACFPRSHSQANSEVRPLSFCVLPDSIFPDSIYENSECVYEKEGEIFLETKCVLSAPEGKVFKINNEDRFSKNFEIDCENLPDSLSFETIKCLKSDFKEEHRKMESCDDDINFGQSCNVVCEEGYKFKEKEAKKEVVTCSEGESNSKTGKIEYVEKHTCVKETDETEESGSADVEEKEQEQKDEGDSSTVIIVVVVVAVILVLFIICSIIAKRKKLLCFKEKNEFENFELKPEENQAEN